MAGTASAKRPEKRHESELEWYRTVYQGDSVPQLTARAVIMGSLLGGVMALSNLYVGLKTGWNVGVSITACILSFTIYRTLVSLFPKLFRTEMSILESNCMQSTASSAGYSTGGTMVSAIPAYLIVTGHHIPMPLLMGWVFIMAALGVFVAIPMKRQMVNIEKLPFPTGTASAETLRSLYSTGRVAVAKARALGISGIVGAVIAWLRDAGIPKALALPGTIGFPGKMMGIPLGKWTLSLELSTILMAAGAIMGFKICWSMLLGATVNYVVLAPWMVRLGAISGNPETMGFRTIVAWSTWAGASMMVTSGLLLFFLQWETIVRAFAGLAGVFSKRKAARESDPMERIEVPSSWFLGGTAFFGVAATLILSLGFGTKLWMGLVAVVMSLVLAIVACRATGESDITPMSAMGKITQLFFGVVAPSNMVTNLMTASVTGNVASSSADLLTDLKSGYLLGANPRKQFLAQFSGIFMGTLVTVPVYYLLVPDGSVLGTEKWPVPTAQVWAAVAKLLGNGVESLHPTARWSIVIGGAVGIVLPLLEKAFPKAEKYIPSALGLGLAMILPFFNSLSMFLGSLAALLYSRANKEGAERYVVPIASGLIAGESIIGIVIALLAARGILG